MAVASSRGSGEQRKWKETEATTRPDRTKVRSEPPHTLKPGNNNVERRVVVPVVYYLSRSGQLEHPHFMEVPLSSPHGLFLRDVISRLNLLRGKSMASQYSWSSKRSYKNGYVWHDLEENDFIHPVHGGEYVLKGSEILETVSKSPGTSSSCSAKNTPDLIPPSGRNRPRNQSWGSIDLHEYKVYKAESTRESDTSTQTEDKRRLTSKAAAAIEEEIIEEVGNGTVEEEEKKDKVEQITELSREEISPPPSDSSPDTLESLIKADRRLILVPSSSSTSSQAVHQGDQSKRALNQKAQSGGGYCQSGRMRASSVIMSLISCGSLSFRDCGAVAVKEHGLSLISQYESRVSRGENQTLGGKEEMMMMMKDHEDVMEEIEKKARNKFGEMALEEKEYFSGSLLMERNKDEFSAQRLKRSSSYNADGSSHLKMGLREEEGMTTKCKPRRLETQPTTVQAKVISTIYINKGTQDGN